MTWNLLILHAPSHHSNHCICSYCAATLQMPQISSLKLLQQCRNVYVCHCYTPFLSASDQLDFLPGVVTIWCGLLVQHPWIVLLLPLGKLKLREIHPSECWWKFSDLWIFDSLLFLLLLRISHDQKPNPFRLDSKLQLSACIALALPKQHPSLLVTGI